MSGILTRSVLIQMFVKTEKNPRDSAPSALSAGDFYCMVVNQSNVCQCGFTGFSWLSPTERGKNHIKS